MAAPLLPQQEGWIPQGEKYPPRNLPEDATMTHVAGRASDKIKYTTMSLWIYAIGNIVLTWFVSEPSEPFFRYPKSLWLIFLCFFLLAMNQEQEAYKYVLHPYDNLLEPWATSYKNWKEKKRFLSAISKPGLATNGWFFVTTLQTLWGGTDLDQNIYEAWMRAIDASMVRFIPGLDSLPTVLFVVMALQFCQPISAACNAIPSMWQYPPADEAPEQADDAPEPADDVLCRRQVDYDTMTGNGAEPKGFRLLFGGKTFHADALMHMAYASRMVLITDKYPAWLLKRVEQKIEAAPDGNNYPRALHMLQLEYHKVSVRVWLYTFLEKSWMFELQGTVFAISRFLQPPAAWYWRFNGQMLISVGISGVSLLMALVDQWNHLRDLGKVLGTVPAALDLQRMPADAYVWKEGGVEFFGSDPETYQRSYTRLSRRRMFCWVGWFLAACFLVHGFVKFVMSWKCHNSLWDIPTSSLGMDDFGCVGDLDPLWGPFSTDKP